METDATCRGAVYPWQYAPAIRDAATRHLEPAMA